MSDASLIRAMPDLVTFIRPDGLIMDHFGGRTLPFLMGAGDLVGRRIQELVEPAAGKLILRLVRRAIAERGSCEAAFQMEEAAYTLRIHAQGPERSMCVIRHVPGDRRPAANGAADDAGANGFFGRLQEAVSDAGLRERTFALCIIYLDGLSDIGQLIDFSIRHRILDALISRLRSIAGERGDVAPIAGTIGDTLLGVVVRADGRDYIRRDVESIAAGLAAPVQLNDAAFTFSPSIGVAIYGQDASSPETLMDHARAAMLEARRSAAGSIQFYSDTLRMLPVLRLDIRRELVEAIRNGQFNLGYLGRHDLVSGRMIGLHAQMRWIHPLRGEIPPAHFLPIAETTGLAPAVSRAALERLALDLPQLRRRFGPEVRICFRPLRQHLTSGQFLSDFLNGRHAGILASGGLDMRIAERTLTGMRKPERILGELLQAGVRCVIDKLGSGSSSLAQLAQTPIAALQVARRFVGTAMSQPRSMRTCQSVAALANALGVASIAPGIDDEAQRACMADIGYAQGVGDLYPPVD